jgi:uncharacterized membrane protein
MVLATVLALASAVLHASWNLMIKRSSGDRYVALWGAMSITSLPLVVLVAAYPPKIASVPWALVSGTTHVPYCILLARGYNRGDYSLVYPIARGGGAALGAIGGVLFANDELSATSALAIAVIVVGLVLLPEWRRGASNAAAIVSALGVALTIGVYSVADARGIRLHGRAFSTAWRYSAASFVSTAVFITIAGIAMGKRQLMVTGARREWRHFVRVGSMSKLTYAMVQFAMTRAPVGYVSALRESSVVFAGLIGWRFLGERGGTRRVICSLVVGLGLVLLVVAR